MADPRVQGAEQLAALAKRLKETGNKGLRRKMLRALRTAAKPLVVEARESALERLPKSGGLNEVVASAKFGVRVRTGSRSAAVRVVAREPHVVKALMTIRDLSNKQLAEASGIDEDTLARRVKCEGKYDLRAIDRGRLRHPVFGNRDVWVTQKITPGWWSTPMREGSPHVRDELIKVMDDVTRKLAHG